MFHFMTHKNKKLDKLNHFRISELFTTWAQSDKKPDGLMSDPF